MQPHSASLTSSYPPFSNYLMSQFTYPPTHYIRHLQNEHLFYIIMRQVIYTKTMSTLLNPLFPSCHCEERSLSDEAISFGERASIVHRPSRSRCGSGQPRRSSASGLLAPGVRLSVPGCYYAVHFEVISMPTRARNAHLPWQMCRNWSRRIIDFELFHARRHDFIGRALPSPGFSDVSALLPPTKQNLDRR